MSSASKIDAPVGRTTSTSRLMYRQLFIFTAESQTAVEMRKCILQCAYVLVVEKDCAVWKETVAQKGQQTLWKKTKQIFAYSYGLVF